MHKAKGNSSNALRIKDPIMAQNDLSIEGIDLGYWKHPRTGEERWYVNNSEELAGLELHHYNTGNISAAYLNGEKISNSQAKRLIGQLGNVWLTADGEIHTKFEGKLTGAVVEAIKAAQAAQEAAAEPEEEPATEEEYFTHAKQVASHGITINGLAYSTSWATEPILFTAATKGEAREAIDACPDFDLGSDAKLTAQRAHVAEGILADYAKKNPGEYTTTIQILSASEYEVYLLDAAGRLVQVAHVKNRTTIIY